MRFLSDRLVTILFVAPVSITDVRGQRRIPANREQTNFHLQIAASNIRSTNFYLGMTEDHEALWTRFDQNYYSTQFRLAQMARVGVNTVRLWGSYRAFLRAKYVENLPYGYWGRVGQFLDMADDYEDRHHVRAL